MEDEKQTSTTSNPEPPKKKRRVRKPSMSALIKSTYKKLERISILSGEVVETLHKIEENHNTVEELKKKLKDI